MKQVFKKRNGALIICNHQSFIDLIVLIYYFRGQFIIYYKEYYLLSFFDAIFVYFSFKV